MSLQVWLPLNGNLDNLGLDPVAMTTNTGATVVNQGKIGKCYSFDATDDWIQGVFDKSKYSGKPMSLACWFKCDKTDAGGVIIDLAADLCLSYSYSSSGIKFNAWRCYTNSSGNRAGSSSNISTNFNADVWHHAVATFEGGFEKVYVDGALVQTFDHTSLYTYNWTPLLNATTYNKISIGKSAGNSDWSGGMVNDVRVYDHCLSQAEVYELAKAKLIHLKLDNGGFGQENLAIGSQGVWVSNLGSADGSRREYQAKSLGQSFPVTSGTKVTVSFDVYMEFKTAVAANSRKLLVYNTNNKGPHYGWVYKELWYSQAVAVGDIIDEHISFVTTVNDRSDSTLLVDWIEFYSIYGTNNWYSISNLHIELGEVETPWAPHSTDAFYIGSQLGTQFDCSGYRHDAITNVITHSSDTARYVCSSVFNGSSSYIKVNDTTWMADRMPAMTINLWAKNSAWNANTHFFSCTEAGGFNTESGNTGYLRFPVHVYTSATEASVAYEFDSQELKLADIPINEWVMLTWVYDSFGTRTYINGELHHTYINTSYGIHFATGVRLFLGCEANAANPYQPWYNGQMSDFRIYATAMGQEDIRLLYHTSGFVDNQGNVFAGELREV